MAQLKEDEWPEPGEPTTDEREARLRDRIADESTGALDADIPDAKGRGPADGPEGQRRTS